MTANTDVHTCSYYCERPGCIRAQRDELVARLTTPPSAPEPEVHSYDPTDQRESVTIRWPDGKCLGYVLDRTRYTDNLPPSATTGVDFAAVASILRRAMRDGAHYGYRRDFILQQALALEALSQQPAAAGEEPSKGADVAQPKRRRYDPSGSLSEYGIFPECDAQPLEHQGDK